MFKLRNVLGAYEWTGDYCDSDPYWTANPTDAQAVGFTNTNDGVFFMSAVNFKSEFTHLHFNYDPTNWKKSYWMARGDGHTVAVDIKGNVFDGC